MTNPAVVTVGDVMSWKCSEYDRTYIEGLFAGRESLTAADLAVLDIPRDDRVWMLAKIV